MTSPHLKIAVVLLAALLTGCSSQATFDTPQQAFDALFNATRARDRAALQQIFGTRGGEFSSGDEAQDEIEMQTFAAALERHAELTPEKDGYVDILVGEDKIAFVAPLVKEDGKWKFDTEAGIEELTNRRIGRNELYVIKLGKVYVNAQNEFYVVDPDNDGVKEFAQKARSSPGKRDGLYWPDTDDGPASPLGPLAAEAAATSDIDLSNTKPQPFHGYYFRILTRQGAGASGGAKNYIDSAGKMTGGHALLAWPEKYDETGVMTFLVDSSGVVYEKDLGPDTAAAAAKITEFNPEGWKKSEP